MNSALKIFNIKEFDLAAIENGLFLVLVNADRKPPHLAMVFRGRVYSLTVKGRQLAEAFDGFYKLIQRNTLKVLFFQIGNPHPETYSKIQENLVCALMEYEKVIFNQVTCLAPIKRFFENNYGIDLKGIDFVFDLIPSLYKSNLIDAVYHIHMGELMEEQSYNLSKYTMQDINSRINDLKG